MSLSLPVIGVARPGYVEMTRADGLGGVTSPARRSLVVLSEPTHLGEAGHDVYDMTGALR